MQGCFHSQVSGSAAEQPEAIVNCKHSGIFNELRYWQHHNNVCVRYFPKHSRLVALLLLERDASESVCGCAACHLGGHCFV